MGLSPSRSCEWVGLSGTWPEDLSVCLSLLSGSLELFHPGSGSPGGGDKHGPPEEEHPGKQVRSWSRAGLQREERGFLPRWKLALRLLLAAVREQSY